jgi:hypothetical protein
MEFLLISEMDFGDYENVLSIGTNITEIFDSLFGIFHFFIIGI